MDNNGFFYICIYKTDIIYMHFEKLFIYFNNVKILIEKLEL